MVYKIHFLMFRFTILLNFPQHKSKAILIFALIFASLQLSAQDYQTIEAKSGDGIYSILRQNGYNPNKYINEFIELNKTKLGKDYTLLEGYSYRLPLIKGKSTKKAQEKTVAPPVKKVPEIITDELFGEKYKDVTIKSKKLAGAVYYLMSGHGGPDPGAIGVLDSMELYEDEYAYDVTLRLSRNLQEQGATVFMIIRDPNDGIRDEQFLTPDKDEVCYPNSVIPLNQKERLQQSTDVVNNLYAQNKGKQQRLVVIHVDSRNEEKDIDVFFYHDQISKSGKRLANTLQHTFKNKYAKYQPGRGYTGSVKERELFVLKNSLPPAVFIELGNINHLRDQKRIIMPGNRQVIANWLCDGLIEDYRRNIK